MKPPLTIHSRVFQSDDGWVFTIDIWQENGLHEPPAQPSRSFASRLYKLPQQARAALGLKIAALLLR